MLQENDYDQSVELEVVPGENFVVSNGLLHYAHNAQCVPIFFFASAVSIRQVVQKSAAGAHADNTLATRQSTFGHLAFVHDVLLPPGFALEMVAASSFSTNHACVEQQMPCRCDPLVVLFAFGSADPGTVDVVTSLAAIAKTNSAVAEAGGTTGAKGEAHYVLDSAYSPFSFVYLCPVLAFWFALRIDTMAAPGLAYCWCQGNV